jgi:hypothetical protein
MRNSISIINFDTRPKSRRVVDMFPDVLRCGIFGPSGVGKTNVLLTILLHVRPFWNIYLCSKTTFQDKYNSLQKLVDSYNHKGGRRKRIKFHKLTSCENLPQPEDIEIGSVIIFDDVLTENQSKIANFFLRGRHRDISCFFLSQTYTKILKKSGIRENFNYLILFRQDLVNLRQIHLEYVTDLDFEKFRELCNSCWCEAYGFLVIDVDNDSCRYKQKFECCLNNVVNTR